MLLSQKRISRIFLFCSMLTLVGLLFAMLSWRAERPAAAASLTTWINNQAAVNVIGQPDFTSNSTGISATALNLPVGVAIDPVTGKLFVSDFNNNRVLRYSAAAALVSGQAAEAVLGQPNFTSNTPAILQSGMNQPTSVFVDGAGRLWVADINNHRVLRFDNAATKANGANADGVLGQPNFTSNTPATTQSGMRFPIGVFVDGVGRLWVADQVNNRVLRFDNAATKANGANADGVLGQSDFTGNTAAVTQSGMNEPTGVFADGAGRLWVADLTNHRVLRFDNVALKANGATADGVLGQPNFTSSAAATTQSGMFRPAGVFGDPDGLLYVSDRNNHRVLIFNNAVAKANGANADNVLGQPDFTTSTANNGGLSATSLNSPYQLFFNSPTNSLYVAESGNNRVKRYTLAQPPTLGAYPYTAVTAGNNNTVTPNAAPSTTGSILSITAAAAGVNQSPFTGTFAVNPATGAVTITNAKPAGTYTVTVMVMDSYGLSSISSFTLTVNNPATCASGNFGFRQPIGSPFGTGRLPISVAVGDFNGDGKQDLAAPNTFDDNVTILLGNGSGGFTQPAGSPFSVGSFPNSVAVGDFNGDGKQDLAVANKFGWSVTILLGNGSGGFAQAAGSPIGVPENPFFVAVGDFNSDGKQDLAVAQGNTTTVMILLGNGSGGFAQAAGSPFTVGSRPSSIAVGDFNGDGKQDLAVTNASSAVVTILLGNGLGGFTAMPSPSVGLNPYSVAVGDFNGDGKQDLAVANSDSSTVTILLGNGSGGFTQAAGSPIGAGSNPRSIAVGDFNGDGKQDLVATNINSDNATVLLGNGNGGFTPASFSPIFAGLTPTGVAVGDFNGDGKQDIAASDQASNVTILLNNCAPTIAAGSVTRQQGSPSGAAVQIATVSDPEEAAGSLSVAVIAGGTATGITLGPITNTNGTISATVAASCAATSGTVRLQVTDSGGVKATSDLQVNVTPNTQPTLSYNNASLLSAGSTTINPANGPGDNGGVPTVVVQSQGTYTGTISVNNTTGVVSLSNAKPAGAHTITLRATDNCGATTDASFTLNVTCPTITVGPATIPAGTVGSPYLPTSFSVTGAQGSVTFSLSGTLPNGMSLVSGQLAGTPTQQGSFPITVTATDAYGCSASQSYTLVINCPTIVISPSALPIAQINAPYPAQTFTASGGNAPYTFSQTGALPAGMSFTGGQLVGTPSAPGGFPIMINVTDNYGCTASRNYTLKVNRPPMALCQNVTVMSDAACGATADINNGSNDPDGDTLTITQSPAGPYAVGTHSVTLNVSDGNGGTSSCQATVTVNAPTPSPTINSLAGAGIFMVNTPVSFAGTFTDLAGTTHTAAWQFVSGATALSAAGAVTESVGSNPGTVSASYTFTASGVYELTLTVANNCGGSGAANTIGGLKALVVIYDPTAGYVVGHGWIDSPAGAYVPLPSLTGKANFGFESKYANGASTPTGNTEFSFSIKENNPKTDFEFSSTSYEWLVVAGARAQYKGTGKITLKTGNNQTVENNCRFILTSIDGALPGGGGTDKFRIRIWGSNGGLVYDNQMNAPDSDDPTTVLGGGNIVIHK